MDQPHVNWHQHGAPYDAGNPGSDGAEDAVGVEYRNPDYPNARITVDTYVVHVVERGGTPAGPGLGQYVDMTTCKVCSESIAWHDGQFIHTAEGNEVPECGTGDGSVAYPEDVFQWEVETMTTFSIVDDEGEEVHCVGILYEHPFHVAFRHPELAERARDNEVERWRTWDTKTLPIFMWDGKSEVTA